MKLTFLLACLALALRAETGAFTIHMILHAIGEEKYEIAETSGGWDLRTTLEYTDRGNRRATTAAAHLKADYTPESLRIDGRPASIEIHGRSATVQEEGESRTFDVPRRFFAIFGASPFAVQMALMRYWKGHGRPAELAVLRATAGADPLRIELAGQETITVSGKRVVLERFTLANLMFGREILWTNDRGELAAAMTFAGGLPMEAVRTEYEGALPQLYRSGVLQEMRNLSAISRRVAPERSGTFAIAGARLVDVAAGTTVDDAVVIVRNGRIDAVGSRAEVPLPKGMAVVEAKGQTLLPGLWEMHTHFSGVEFGPALLGAGITTARDCGGEFDYLVAERDAIAREGAIGPRLLLAGLVDAGGPKAFGHVTAETPEEGRRVVNRYHAAGFEQIKLYTYLTPEVVRAITAEAHRLGMTVTGHVPQAMNTMEGVEAGMDQINHLNYVSNLMRTPGERGAIDLGGEIAQKAIRFLREHRTVVDPTAGWGEMAGHSKEVDAASFEPGVTNAPFVLANKFRAMGGNTTAEQMRARMAQTVAVIASLHKAGVTIVPGTDTGLVGYGLDRELELYVEAGMTPMEAIQSATIVSARAMHLDRDSGAIARGMRADLILVEGDPIADIRELRKVTRVVANGRLYDCGTLRRSVGFHR